MKTKMNIRNHNKIKCHHPSDKICLNHKCNKQILHRPLQHHHHHKIPTLILEKLKMDLKQQKTNYTIGYLEYRINLLRNLEEGGKEDLKQENIDKVRGVINKIEIKVIELPESKMYRNIVKTINCTSYSEEDGCIQDTYTFEIKVETGYVYINHEICCGLDGKHLFCAPPIITNYETPIPEHITQMINMFLVNDDFKIEPRYRSSAIEKFIVWLDESMKQISREQKEKAEKINKLEREKDELEKEMEDQYLQNKKFMDININLLRSLQNK
jgi:hypothetical protein